MASGQRSTWPIVLLLGLCISLLVGAAAAFAAPSDGASDWWHDDEPVRVTATVTDVDPSEGTVVLGELITYQPPQDQAGTDAIGTLTVTVADLGGAGVGDTVDAVVARHDGRWSADELLLLDTD